MENYSGYYPSNMPFYQQGNSNGATMHATAPSSAGTDSQQNQGGYQQLSSPRSRMPYGYMAPPPNYAAYNQQQQLQAYSQFFDGRTQGPNPQFFDGRTQGPNQREQQGTPYGAQYGMDPQQGGYRPGSMPSPNMIMPPNMMQGMRPNYPFYQNRPEGNGNYPQSQQDMYRPGSHEAMMPMMMRPQYDYSYGMPGNQPDYYSQRPPGMFQSGSNQRPPGMFQGGSDYIPMARGEKKFVHSSCYLCRGKLISTKKLTSCELCHHRVGQDLGSGGIVNLRSVSFCSKCLMSPSIRKIVDKSLSSFAMHHRGEVSIVDNVDRNGCLKMYVCQRMNGCWNKIRRSKELLACKSKMESKKKTPDAADSGTESSSASNQENNKIEKEPIRINGHREQKKSSSDESGNNIRKDGSNKDDTNQSKGDLANSVRDNEDSSSKKSSTTEDGTKPGSSTDKANSPTTENKDSDDTVTGKDESVVDTDEAKNEINEYAQNCQPIKVDAA